MRDALRLALGTLTTWRVPPPRAITPRVAGTAMTLAPAVMVPLLVLLGAAAALLLLAGAPAALTAAAGVAALVLSTRAMHLDGLADLTDGLSASYDPAAALAVMRRSDIGPSGVTAIALTLALQITALAALVEAGAPGLALAAVAVLTSRGTLAWACRRGYPAASDTGLGATVAGTVPVSALLGNVAALVLTGLALSLTAGLPWWYGPLTYAAGTAATLALLLRTRSRLGGMTGDVLGAGIEVSLTAALATGAVVLT